MARPSTIDREEAVAIAMNTIWRDGFDASSVKALSEKLGITRSSFYNAFSTREALFREVLEAYFTQSPDRPLSDATPETPIRPLLTQIIRAICQRRACDPEGRGCLIVNSVSELCPANTALSGVLAEIILGRIDRIEQLLHWARERDELPAETDIRTMALAVQTLMFGLNVTSKVLRDEDDLWAIAKITLQGLGLYDEGKNA